jgi:hypothetical protein
MKKVLSLTSTFRLWAAEQVGADRPHTKESRREKLKMIIAQPSAGDSVR